MPRELNVEAVLSGRLAPSSRFRVIQHVEALERRGIHVRAKPPRVSKYASLPRRWARRPLVSPAASAGLCVAKLAVRTPAVVRSWSGDLTWLEREVYPGALTLEPFLHRPVLFDVDDAIWLLSSGHERAASAIARRSACVVAGNDYLADWFSSHNSAVERVWTAVDVERFRPDDRRSTAVMSSSAGPATLGPDRRFVIGWTGTGSTLRFLSSIEPAIARFMAQAPDSRLVVMSDFAPSLREVPADRFDFVPWRPDREAKVVASFDVGLMPLGEGKWARGKCSLKMLQYMACAVPSIVSPFGMNAQMLAMAEVGLAAADQTQWVDALHALYEDPERARAVGVAGRELAERSFSVPVIAGQIASVMRRYA
ncbi:MAG: glycosyltransferase [Acidimicrobiales bacterium]